MDKACKSCGQRQISAFPCPLASRCRTCVRKQRHPLSSSVNFENKKPEIPKPKAKRKLDFGKAPKNPPALGLTKKCKVGTSHHCPKQHHLKVEKSDSGDFVFKRPCDCNGVPGQSGTQFGKRGGDPGFSR